MTKLFGDVFADTHGDFLFVINGNVPGGGLRLESELPIDRFERLRVSLKGTIQPSTTGRDLSTLRVMGIATHADIANAAFLLSKEDILASPEDNWLKAEDTLLSESARAQANSHILGPG